MDDQGPDKRLIIGGTGTICAMIALLVGTAACHKGTGKADLFYAGEQQGTTVAVPPAKPVAKLAPVNLLYGPDESDEISTYSFVDPKNGCRYLIAEGRRGTAMVEDSHTACIKS